MRQLRKVLEIGRVNLLRQVRDRGDLFFVFVLPTIIIVALGLQFGGVARARLGVVAPAGDAAAEALVADHRGGHRPVRDPPRRGRRDAREPGRARPARGRARDPGRVHGVAGLAGHGGGRGTSGRPTRSRPGCGPRSRRRVARLGAITTAARVSVAEGLGTPEEAACGRRGGLRDGARRRGVGDAGRRAGDVRGLLPVHVRRVHAAHPVHVPDVDDGGRAARLHAGSWACRGG